jgi:tight adherence protein B
MRPKPAVRRPAAALVMIAATLLLTVAPAAAQQSTSQETSSNTLWYAAAFALAGLSLTTLYLVRRHNPVGPETLENPVDPTSEGITPTFGEHAYAGATDAGAYEEGGAAYEQHTADPMDTGPLVSDEAPTNIFTTLQTAVVSLADRAAAEAGKDRVIAKKLEAAGSQLRPGEWLVMAAGGTLAALLFIGFVFGWVLAAAASALTAIGFWWALSFRAERRGGRFASQLPETLQLLAGGLRGGSSLIQALQTVADEADSPTAEEFQRIITEARLGRDLGVSFQDLSKRVDNQDFNWVVTAIEIHREVGGDLAGVLDRVGGTIRARNRVRGQVKSLSAEGRISGLILFMLPPAMVGVISIVNRDYLDELANTSEGQMMLVVSGVLLLAGGAWLKRLSRFVF